MPLPDKSIAWPPADLSQISPVLEQWSAWYEGTPEALREAYGRGMAGGVPADYRHVALRDSQHRGGMRSMLQRFWWGRPVRDITQQQRDMLHVPIAADLCQASADLLFADQPTLTVESASTQKRLDELANDGMYTTLAETAEITAALGGGYLRVVWDKAMFDAPFLSPVDADGAWPEFAWGRLRGVTFWHVVHRDGQTIWRHLERHELDLNGIGVIEHGLYEGSPQDLGRRVPLTEQAATQPLVAALNKDSLVSTETPGLAVTYIPNQRPQRRWRKDQIGCNLGRSDLDGVEGLMDSLDETYSSWMRDVRLGKARIVIAKTLLDSLGPGNGATFDSEQEIYSPVNALASAKDGGLPIEQVQFAIRVAEHQQTAQQLVEDILRTAGYSSQTFGEGPADRIQTATEVQMRERRSFLTRDRKIRLWRPGIADAIEKLMAVDVALFNGKYTVERPEVNFSDGVQETPLALAQTAQALRAADAASTEVLVGIVHPDWDDAAITEEVAKIAAEKPPLPAPLAPAAPAHAMPGQPAPMGEPRQNVN